VQGGPHEAGRDPDLDLAPFQSDESRARPGDRQPPDQSFPAAGLRPAARMAHATLLVGRHRAVLHEPGEQLAESTVIVARADAKVVGQFLEGEGAPAVGRQEFKRTFLELFRWDLRVGPADRRWRMDQNENR
jgi:hypothetical protein